MQVELRCSFCNKGEHEVAKLARGPNVNICDSCVRIATKIIENSPRGPSSSAWRALARKLIVRLLGALRRAGGRPLTLRSSGLRPAS